MTAAPHGVRRTPKLIRRFDPDLLKVFVLLRGNCVISQDDLIDLVDQRAPDGFAELDEVASHAELEAIVRGYSRTAGFDQAQVNR